MDAEAADRLAIRELVDTRFAVMIASLRYLDTFAKIEQRWYFAERKLIVDWTETRTLAS